MAENTSSLLSYEEFKSDLQNEAKNDPKVVNSTMIDVLTDGYRARTDAGNGHIAQKLKIIHLPLPYKCQECAKEYRKIENLRVHFIKHLTRGSDSGQSENDNQPFNCRHKGCKKYFISKPERRNHEKRHVPASNFNCERIQKVFKYK